MGTVLLILTGMLVLLRPAAGPPDGGSRRCRARTHC